MLSLSSTPWRRVGSRSKTPRTLRLDIWWMWKVCVTLVRFTPSTAVREAGWTRVDLGAVNKRKIAVHVRNWTLTVSPQYRLPHNIIWRDGDWMKLWGDRLECSLLRGKQDILLQVESGPTLACQPLCDWWSLGLTRPTATVVSNPQ
jgi:hypothetical protein